VIVALAGVLVVVAAAIAALRPRKPLARLHFLTVVTSLGAPLVGLGVIIANGWSLTTAGVALITVLLVATGPVLSAASGRLIERLDE